MLKSALIRNPMRAHINLLPQTTRIEKGAAPEVVIGHSLGGKVVLEYVKQIAQQRCLERPKHVISANRPRADKKSNTAQRQVNRMMAVRLDIPLLDAPPC
jgi:surfactin synthase thioesterase subunit